MDATGSSRRQFLNQAARVAGVAIVAPAMVSCGEKKEESGSSDGASVVGPLAVPSKRPSGWNPIQFNLQRGLAGAIPATYHASISGVDGDKLHIGKHILYNAPIDKALVPAGFIALMAGDFTRGYAKHPASAAHWYDWISLSKEGSASVYKSTFQAWPVGSFLVFGGGVIEDAGGANTVYLCSLPPDVKLGDTIRVIGHCNIHGEYVDFITL